MKVNIDQTPDVITSVNHAINDGRSSYNCYKADLFASYKSTGADKASEKDLFAELFTKALEQITQSDKLSTALNDNIEYAIVLIYDIYKSKKLISEYCSKDFILKFQAAFDRLDLLHKNLRERQSEIKTINILALIEDLLTSDCFATKQYDFDDVNIVAENDPALQKTKDYINKTVMELARFVVFFAILFCRIKDQDSQ